VAILRTEISALSNESWDRLPEMKKAKVVLASRLLQLKAEAETADREAVDGIESLIDELEDQSHRKIQARIELIGKQVLALQELHLYWLECLHLSFRKFTKRPLGNDASIV
jgi:hypothetical protein